MNLYAYVGGNPVMFVDPSGFKRIGIFQTQILQFQQDAFDIANGFAFSEFGFKPILTVNTHSLG